MSYFAENGARHRVISFENRAGGDREGLGDGHVILDVIGFGDPGWRASAAEPVPDFRSPRERTGHSRGRPSGMRGGRGKKGVDTQSVWG